MAKSIAAVRWPSRHDPLEPVALCFFAVDVKEWWIDAQLVAGYTSQALNVKRRSGNRIRANSRNIVCSKNKNIAIVRFNKVVGAFINKHLVACVDRAAGDNLPSVNKAPWKDVK